MDTREGSSALHRQGRQTDDGRAYYIVMTNSHDAASPAGRRGTAGGRTESRDGGVTVSGRINQAGVVADRGTRWRLQPGELPGSAAAALSTAAPTASPHLSILDLLGVYVNDVCLHAGVERPGGGKAAIPAGEQWTRHPYRGGGLGGRRRDLGRAGARHRAVHPQHAPRRRRVRSSDHVREPAVPAHRRRRGRLRLARRRAAAAAGGLRGRPATTCSAAKSRPVAVPPDLVGAGRHRLHRRLQPLSVRAPARRPFLRPVVSATAESPHADDPRHQR